MRVLTILFGCLAAGSCLGQSQLVLTRLHDSEYLERDTTLRLNLRKYFQYYEAPGPVATFAIDMPELDEGELILNFQGKETRIVKYKLKNSGTYDDPYSVGGDDYVWNQHLVEFQLRADQTPMTVANFMTYVSDGDYKNTIIHRNESTGTVFRPQIIGADFSGHRFIPLPIIQTGGYRLYHNDQYVLEPISQRAPIPLEEASGLTQGTLAMARSSMPDSATSQFFLNLEDNSSDITFPHAVFGELINPEQDLPVLYDFANAPVYDLSSPYIHGEDNLFPTLPFEAMPLYAPFPYEKDSFSRITSITIPEGVADNITYSYEWVIAGEEPTGEELANQSAFEVIIHGSNLKISRRNTGSAEIRIIGSGEDGQSVEFRFNLTAYNPDAMETFPDSVINQSGWMENEWYGWVAADTYPVLYHQNHGYQYVSEASTPNSFFIFDLRLGSWLYIDSLLYPNIYSYKLDTWLWYQLGSGSFNSYRWFYLYDTENPRWVTEGEISPLFLKFFRCF